MPVISIAIGKGGAGKTTTALILASELAKMGSTVTVIDADPNQHLVAWSKKPGVPANLAVVGDVTLNDIIDTIEDAAGRTAFVIVDLEGVQSLMMGNAVGMSDLVIIPMQGSQLDASKVSSMIRLIQNQGKPAKKIIPYVVALTRTSPALNPGTQKHIEQSFADAGIPMTRTEIYDREAYKALFSFGGTLETLKGKRVSNVETAQRNAHAFAVEIVEMVKPTATRLQVVA